MPDRRTFLKTAAALAAGQLAAQTNPKRMIGIQIGAVSFVDEGVEPVLDILQQRGAVNTLFLAVFTYGRGIAGRQVPGQPLPDHGAQKYDTEFYGGNYATGHPEYYKDTVLKETRAKELGNFDVLATVLPAAKKGGMKTMVGVEGGFSPHNPGIQPVPE